MFLPFESRLRLKLCLHEGTRTSSVSLSAMLLLLLWLFSDAAAVIYSSWFRFFSKPSPFSKSCPPRSTPVSYFSGRGSFTPGFLKDIQRKERHDPPLFSRSTRFSASSPSLRRLYLGMPLETLILRMLGDFS